MDDWVTVDNASAVFVEDTERKPSFSIQFAVLYW